jgi:hypothetical protein
MRLLMMATLFGITLGVITLPPCISRTTEFMARPAIAGPGGGAGGGGAGITSHV